jgi:hypothetical protein
MNSDSTTPESRRANPLLWCGLAVFLLAWNLVPALFANPFTLIQGYDGVQYQLLTRNRLQGHDELGDTAHTVRTEGRHPMWRPGLVWIQEGFARCVGSVQLAAGLASGLGTALLELAMLWLTWRCFGTGTCLLLLLSLLAPVRVSVHFLRLAVGQGPEPWAAAALLGGLAALVEARQRRSWTWAILAGACAGLSEWFRTGNLILFAVPCAVYGLAAWRQRDRLGSALPATAVAVFVAMAALCDLIVYSPINKATANLWGNLVEYEGPEVEVFWPDKDDFVFMHIGGMTIAPGSAEVYYDHLVRRSREMTPREFFWRHRDTFLPLYFERLGDVAASGALGLRVFTGELLLVAFLFQVAISLRRRDAVALHALALACAALTFYLGPVVLLQGDAATHYVFVMLPLALLVATRGLVEMMLLARAWCAERWPLVTQRLHKSWGRALALVLLPLACLTVSYYQGALAELNRTHTRAVDEQTALDALHLEGRKLAHSNMSWFVDRNIQSVLLPYATVPELERYARTQNLDGILICDKEKQPFFRATPHGSLAQLDQALRQSRFFGPPQVSGGWRWYPAHRSLASKE